MPKKDILETKLKKLCFPRFNILETIWFTCQNLKRVEIEENGNPFLFIYFS